MNHRSRPNTQRSGASGDGDNRGRNGSPNRNSHDGGAGNGRGRGNPRQLREKYMTLAQEAISAGNIIDAETYYQHADHYYRLIRDEHGRAPELKREQGSQDQRFLQGMSEDFGADAEACDAE